MRAREIFSNQRGSFTADVFILLPALAMIGIYVRVRRGFSNLFFIFFASAVLFSFMLVGLLWYLDVWKIPQFISPMTGNDFMWNWPLYPLFGFRLVSDIPSYANGVVGPTGWDLLALFLFCIVYPVIFGLGTEISFLLFGRSTKQKGIVDFLFPFKKGYFN